MEDSEPAFKKRGVPRILNIKWNDLYFKDPPMKNDVYNYRCRKKNCKYYIQIDKTNIEKILKNETPINFNEINKQTGHDETTKK